MGRFRRWTGWSAAPCASAAEAAHGVAALVVTLLLTFSLASSTLIGFGTQPAAAGGERVEQPSLRTRTSATYRNPNGSLTTTLSSRSLHFRDNLGKWRDIDASLVDAGIPGYDFATKANGFDTLFKRRLADSFLRFEIDDRPVSVSLAEASDAYAVKESARLTYEGAFAKVDLRYEPFADGIKETLVLADESARTQYRFFLDSHGAGALKATRLPGGSWAVHAAGRPTPLFFLGAPYVADTPGGRAPANASQTSGAPAQSAPTLSDRADGDAAAGLFGDDYVRATISPVQADHGGLLVESDGAALATSGRARDFEPVSLQVVRVGERLAVDLTVDPAWLQDPARRFPVLVDPTIVIQPSAHDGEFEFNCLQGSPCPQRIYDEHAIGTMSTDAAKFRAGYKFDLGSIPVGANVTDAQLRLYANGNCGYGSNCKATSHQLDAHRITSSWSLTSSAEQMSWEAASLASATLPANFSAGWVGWNLTDTVKNWLSGSPAYPNQGVLVKRSSEPQGAGAPAFYSRWYHYDYSGDITLTPKLEVTYAGDAVELLEPDTLHADGADLRWTRYTGENTGAPFQKYEVHRSLSPGFAPSAATLIATIAGVDVTSYRDTTADASKSFTYKVVVNGEPGNERTVTLPGAGRATKVLQPGPTEGTDTYLGYAAGGANCANYGSDERIWVGNSSSDKYRGLVRFDLRDIPTGATLYNADLSLWHPDAITPPITVSAHRVTSSWLEGTGTGACTADGASWTNSQPGVRWASDGGDYDSASVDDAVHVSSSGPGWDTFWIDSAVQKWVNGEAPNLGLVLKRNNEALVGNSYSYYASDQSTAPTLRPKLELEYSEQTTPGGPTVSLSAPSAGDVLSGTVTVAADVSEDGKLTQVEFFDGTTSLGSDTSAPYSIAWNTATATYGAHTLKAVAIDDAGTSTTSVTVTVTVDNSGAPTATLTAPATPSYLNTVKADTPAGYWRLGEASGTTASDASGNARTGTYAGTRTHAQTSLISGDANTSVLFKNASTDGKVTITNSSAFLSGSAFTAEAWVKYSSVTTAGQCNRVLARGWGTSGGWMLAVCQSTGGVQQAQFGVNSTIATATVAPGAGMFLAGSYDGSSVKLYLNGALAATASTSGTLSTASSLLIGATLNNDITIDEPAVFASALTAAKIKNHYDVGSGGGSTVTGTVTVNATASDDNGVSKVEFFADDIRIGDPDTTSPYSVNWDTTNAAEAPYDGAHTLTAKAYDGGGHVTSSAPINVTVRNAGVSKYLGEINATTALPQSVIYNPEAQTQDKYGVDLTVKNTSSTTWLASEVVLRYRWLSPDAYGQVVYTDSADIALGANLDPGKSVTLPALLLAPPALQEAVNRARYTLRFDLFDKGSGGGWFADKGNKPLDNQVIVNKALIRNALGVERYYNYTGQELGAGMQHMLNVANGNSILRWTPFMAPGRGLPTVVDLTYNALEKKCDCPAGNNWSLAISGLTRFGNPLDIHPNKADELGGRANVKYIELTDGDGTTHKFTSADGITYQEPAGVHLFLRRYSTTDALRKWALTRPDRVTFFYSDEGYPTFVRDKNGNEISFTLQTTPSGEDPGGPKKRIAAVTDASGRSFAIAYYSKAEAKKAHVRGKIKAISDHSGSTLKFDYYEDGNLLRLTQTGKATGAETIAVPDRSFVFTYTTSSGNSPAISDPTARANPEPRTSNQSTRLYSVRDPRGKETLFSYLGSGVGEDRWKLVSITDRKGAATAFDYNTATRLTTVTAPLARLSKYAYDSDGKVTTITNPKDQTTTVTWTTDRHVDTVTEPGGGFSDYDYNDNGYPTVEKVLRDKKDPGTPADDVFTRTEVEYANITATNGDGGTTDTIGSWKPGRSIPHISQPIKKTEPSGFAAESTRGDDFQWNFSYDSKGNLEKVIEPGPEHLPAQRPTTVHAYDASGNGDLISITDPNGHITKFQNYDVNGFPTRIEDAETNLTRFGYDSDGQLLWLQDARHTNSTGREDKTDKSQFYYDEFHRLTRQSVPKSTELTPGQVIWTADEYDANDNLVAQYSPEYGGLLPVTGSKTLLEYDAMDRQTAVTVLHDPANSDPAQTAPRRTETAYDLAGRATRITRPLGVATPAIPDDYVAEYVYDGLDGLLKETHYPKDGTAPGARITNYCYDLAGDLRSVTAPRNAVAPAEERFSTCPAETSPHIYAATTATYTTKLSYFADHLRKSETDQLGNADTVEYDLNGNVTTTTDADQNVQMQNYDERDRLIKSEETLYDGRNKGTLKTIFEYDKVGNLVREVSPRAVDTVGVSGPFISAPYVTEYVYDNVDRPIRVKLPAHAATRQAWVHNFYDQVGNLTSTSLPVETADRSIVADPTNKERRTDVTYYDVGWVRTTDDPGKLLVKFDYSAEGWQDVRQGLTRDEDGAIVEAGEEKWTYYEDGLVRTQKDPNGDPQEFIYDLNDNLIRSEDANGVDRDTEAPLTVETEYNGFDAPLESRQRKRTNDPWLVTNYAYDLNGNIEQRIDPKLRRDGTDERRTNNFSYDASDRLTKHIDLGGPSCGDEQKIESAYLNNGWVGLEKVSKSTIACESETGWPLRQQTAYEHFRNGLVKKQTTWHGVQLPANVVESHALDYETDGVYMNGHKTVDSFSLKGPDDTEDGPAECGTYDSDPKELCKYRYAYDGRERITSWSLRRKDVNGEPGTALTAIEYTLDENTPDMGNRADALQGDIVQEVTSGLWMPTPVTRTFNYYPSGRLKTVTTGSATEYHAHWPSRGTTISCVTATEQPDSAIPTQTCKDGSAQPGLLDWSKLDTLDRLKTFKSQRSEATLDSSYTYDAFDRVSWETENPNGAGTRRTDFGYLGLTAAAVTEAQSGIASDEKSYTYDASSRRVGMTLASGGAVKDYTFARNVHGDVSALLGDAGGAAATYSYEPYGAHDSHPGVAGSGLSRGDTDISKARNPYRFNDRRFDHGSGSTDMGARRYSPDLGRFLQQDFYRDALADSELNQDPVARNRYAYAGGNPVAFSEVDGHSFAVADGGGGLSVSGCANPGTSVEFRSASTYKPGGPYGHGGSKRYTFFFGTTRAMPWVFRIAMDVTVLHWCRTTKHDIHSRFSWDTSALEEKMALQGALSFRVGTPGGKGRWMRIGPWNIEGDESWPGHAFGGGQDHHFYDTKSRRRKITHFRYFFAVTRRAVEDGFEGGEIGFRFGWPPSNVNITCHFYGKERGRCKSD